MSDNNQLPKVLVLELTNRQPSEYELEGSRENGKPIFLDCPAVVDLLTTSVVIEEGKRREIRYIKGASTIYVDEQVEKNIHPNPMQDMILIEGGTLTVVNDGLDPCLIPYLLACEYNLANKKNLPNATTVFHVIDTEVKAVQEMEDIDDLAAALGIVASLRQKKPGGGYEYKESDIDYYVKLFGVVNVDTYVEKLAALRWVATNKPEYFAKLVYNKESSIMVEIATAREIKVLSIDGDEASFEDGAKILAFKSKKTEKKIEELVKFFMSKEGQIFYERMQLDVSVRQESRVGIA